MLYLLNRIIINNYNIDTAQKNNLKISIILIPRFKGQIEYIVHLKFR